jgi:hypothetical protein
VLTGSAEDVAQQWTALLAARLDRGSASIRRLDPLSSILSNSLYRLEIHDSGMAVGPALEPATGARGVPAVLDDGGVIADVSGLPPALLRPGRALQVWRDADGSTVSGQATVALSDAGEPMLTGDLASAGPVILGALATFKWSAVNGAVAFPVVGCALETGPPPVIRVNLGSEGDNGFDLSVGDWVELTCDIQDLEEVPGFFYQVAAVDQAGLVIRLANPDSGPLPDLPMDRHPVMRRWDTPLGADGVPVGPPDRTLPDGQWQALDAGISVAFGTGNYVSGDYWTFTARDVAGGVIAWPWGAPSPQPPQGIDHVYAKLGEFGFASALEPQVSDQRNLFKPLVEPVPGWAPASTPAAPAGLAGAVVFDAPLLTVLDGATRAVWTLNLNGGAWTAGPELRAARKQGGYGRLGYDLWALGGQGLGTNSMEVLSPGGRWRPVHGLAKPVSSPGVGAAGQALYVFGGLLGGKGGAVAFIQQVDPDGVQLLKTALPTARSAPCVAVVGGRLFVIGGMVGDQASSANEGFDPLSRSCRVCASLPDGVTTVAAVGWRDVAAVLGQTTDGPVLLAYDPAEDAWTNLPTPPEQAMALFTSGEALYAIGASELGGPPAGLFRLA